MNIAVGLARLGVPSAGHQLGDDEHGGLIREHVAASGVELLRSRRTTAPTATATARLDDRAGRRTSSSWTGTRAGCPDRRPPPACTSGSIGATLLPGADGRRAGASGRRRPACRSASTPTCGRRSRPRSTRSRGGSRRSRPLASLVKLSDEDAETYLPGRDPRDTLTSCSRMARCWGSHPGSRRAHMASAVPGWTYSRRRTSCDTIGAGDSLMARFSPRSSAGVVAGRLERAVLELIGRQAVAAAAVTVSRLGADPPSRAELNW